MDRRTKNIESEKARLIREAQKSFLQNRISVEEYETLIESVLKAETADELAALAPDTAEPEKNVPEIIPGKNHWTVLSYGNTPGSMIDGTAGKFITVLGENTITFDESGLSRDDTVLNVVSVLGTTTIYVPEDAIVITFGDYLLGDLWVDRVLRGREYAREGKRIIVFGEVFLGEIVIKVRKEKTAPGQKIKRIIDGIKRIFRPAG